MTISCLVIGYIAFTTVTADQVTAAVPENWKNLFFGMELNIDWTGYIDSVNTKIEEDGFSLFGFLFMMMIFKGIFASLAGPVPSYDMQRVLSTKNEVEASKMSALTILVLFIPRYLMITGFAVLGLVYLGPELQNLGSGIDFETILPIAIQRYVPIGFKGLLLAGLLAAFMGTFAAFINAAPAYVVNDIYKKYIKPDATSKRYVLKWIWWRFNAYGYFGGMLAGLIAATIVPQLFPETSAIYLFPVVLVISFIGCLTGVFLGKPDDMEVLKNFYKTTKPWGFWKPVYKEIKKEDHTFTANTDFWRDTFNCVIGIVWQMTFVLCPMYLIIKDYYALGIVVITMIVTSIVLKYTWYDKLSEEKSIIHKLVKHRYEV